jgi:hypothetical protein
LADGNRPAGVKISFSIWLWLGRTFPDASHEPQYFFVSGYRKSKRYYSSIETNKYKPADNNIENVYNITRKYHSGVAIQEKSNSIKKAIYKHSLPIVTLIDFLSIKTYNDRQR